MADLITSARAKYNLDNRTTTSAEDTTISALVTACTAAIRRYCRRNFTATTFDELYGGRGQQKLLLKDFPVISVESVRYGPEVVLKVKNTSASNQLARVTVGLTGLTLSSVAGGVADDNTDVVWNTSVTLSAVATAVGDVGSGWTAEAVADYALYPSADLFPQGAYSCKDVWAGLRLHTRGLSDYELDAARGWLTLAPGIDPDRAPPEGPTFEGGSNYWRVRYTAGWGTVPEDVQEACAQWVAALFWQTKRDPGLLQDWVPGTRNLVPERTMPGPVKALLGPYRKIAFSRD